MNVLPTLGYLVCLATDTPRFLCVDCYDGADPTVKGTFRRVQAVRSADSARTCITCGDTCGGPVMPDCGPRVFRVEWADLEGKPYHEDFETYREAVTTARTIGGTARIMWVAPNGVELEVWQNVHGPGGYRKAKV